MKKTKEERYELISFDKEQSNLFLSYIKDIGVSYSVTNNMRGKASYVFVEATEEEHSKILERKTRIFKRQFKHRRR